MSFFVAKNIIKNKNMFKGIFIDEAESFSENEIDDLLPNSLRRTNQKQ